MQARLTGNHALQAPPLVKRADDSANAAGDRPDVGLDDFISAIFRPPFKGIVVLCAKDEAFRARRFVPGKTDWKPQLYFGISTVKEVPDGAKISREESDLVQTHIVVLDDINTNGVDQGADRGHGIVPGAIHEALAHLAERALIGVVAEGDDPAQRRQDQRREQRRDADLQSRVSRQECHQQNIQAVA
jgi:hypothetical protein